ncbi:hypothetical protein [Hyalangium sp.]|uniref:hypothetical protein n=1 Tax=Hyalangium sp. TaxID=2028555 RepID=UPI002D54CDEB|nr:hypothetical protein [Hyalangium sp.]HYI01685.1 hypothetical protein [Hyalangium sp.]
MKRVLLALVLSGWVTACGSGSSPTDTGGGGDTPAGVKGSVTIHTRFWESKVSEKATSAHVLLGDGSRFLQQIGPSSDVTFEDPSLEGPQDITLVLHHPVGEDDYTQAYTYLAVNTSEVWLQFTPKDPPATTPQSAFITGKVSGLADPRNTFVRVVGAGVSGEAPVTLDGSYRILATGTLPAVVNLFVLERHSDVSGLKAVGLRKGVTVLEGQQTAGQDLSLDHLVDQELKLTIDGASAYQQRFSSATLSFYQDNRYLFALSEDTFGSDPSRLPSSVPAIALTAPFETTLARLGISVGFSSDLPAGAAYTGVPVENLSSGTLSLPKPMTLTSPTLGTWHEPGSVSSKDLSFQWRADAEAQRVELTLSPDLSSPNEYLPWKFSWRVTAPGSVTSFTPFRLPGEVWPYSSPFTYGQYRVTLSSRFQGGTLRYEDFFAQNPTQGPFARTWSTQLDGTLEFK